LRERRGCEERVVGRVKIVIDEIGARGNMNVRNRYGFPGCSGSFLAR